MGLFAIGVIANKKSLSDWVQTALGENFGIPAAILPGKGL
jgi:hypothetical protein